MYKIKVGKINNIKKTMLNDDFIKFCCKQKILWTNRADV